MCQRKGLVNLALDTTNKSTTGQLLLFNSLAPKFVNGASLPLSATHTIPCFLLLFFPMVKTNLHNLPFASGAGHGEAEHHALGFQQVIGESTLRRFHLWR